jgi:hypothetical protein
MLITEATMDLCGGVPLLGRGVLVVGEDLLDERLDRAEDGSLSVPGPDGLGFSVVEDMPDGLACMSELSGDLSDGHAIASSPPNRAIVVHREHVLGLRGVIDPCGNVHRTEGGWGGLLLDDHFAPGWAPLTRSFPHGFTHLPAGCTILMERVARQYVLENIRQNLRQTRSTLVGTMRELAETLGRLPKQPPKDVISYTFVVVPRSAPWPHA